MDATLQVLRKDEPLNCVLTVKYSSSLCRRRLNINVKVIFKITVALIRHCEGSMKIDRIDASLVLTVINELLQPQSGSYGRFRHNSLREVLLRSFGV